MTLDNGFRYDPSISTSVRVILDPLARMRANDAGSAEFLDVSRTAADPLNLLDHSLCIPEVIPCHEEGS